MPASITTRRCNTSVVATAAALLALLCAVLAGDRPTPVHAAPRLDLPPLMLWAWDHDDDLHFIDTRDTGIAYLAATLTLRGEDVALAPRHNPLTVPDSAARMAVAHVETDRASPPQLSEEQLRRFVAALTEVAADIPQRALQVDFEATASQRSFLLDAIAALRRELPAAAVSVTALASWCATENWTAALAADEIVPMLFRMGYDGRRVRARLANGTDFRGPECRRSIGIATNELPQAVPPGRRIYVFNPRRWSADAYQAVRARINRWPHDGLLD